MPLLSDKIQWPVFATASETTALELCAKAARNTHVTMMLLRDCETANLYYMPSHVYNQLRAVDAVADLDLVLLITPFRERAR